VKTGRNDPCPCGSSKKYKRFCLGKESGEQCSGPAQVIADDIASAAAEQPFESLEELSAFTTELTNERNRWALADFSGLSPEQMSHLLYAPFTSPETVRIPGGIEPGPDVEILGIFLALVEAIGESGLKATAKGNLPLKFCKSMAQQLQEATDDQRRLRIGGIRSATQFNWAYRDMYP
jgi:SEC-C motif-containing protein